MLSGRRSQNDKNGKKNEATFLNKFYADETFRNSILTTFNIPPNTQNSKLDHKGGMKYNYDFVLSVPNHGDEKIELKAGKNLHNISQLPQIIQLPIKNTKFGERYIKEAFNILKYDLINIYVKGTEEYKEINDLDYEKYYKYINDIKHKNILTNVYASYTRDKKINELFAERYEELTKYFLSKITSEDKQEIGAIVVEILKQQITKTFFLLDTNKTEEEAFKSYKIFKMQNFSNTFSCIESVDKSISVYMDKYKAVCLFRWKNGSLIAMPCLQIKLVEL